MMLAQIRSYLQERGQVTLHDVATHFDISLDNVRFAMDYWQKQGKVRQLGASCGSGGCSSCGDEEDKVIYIWSAAAMPVRWARPAKHG